MLIESVSVKHFGLLHHFDLKLGDKLNVIEGSNESGKSTLSAFIRFMLYGFSSDEAGIDERRRRTSWDSGTAEGEMIVSVKGRRYRIERYSAIVRGLSGEEKFRDRTRTIDVAEGSLVTETDAGEYFLGVPNGVYVSSAFISQLDDTRVGEDRMLDQITSILFSGDEKKSAERASEMLRRRRDKMIASAGEQGDLSRLRQRAAALVEERERAVEINRLLLLREAELTQSQNRMKTLEEELFKLEKLKGSFKTVAVINHFDKLHTLERESQLLDGEEAEFRLGHTRCGFFPDASYRTELAINRRVAGDSYAAYKTAEEELVTLREESERHHEREAAVLRIDRHGGEAKVRAGLSAICRNAVAFLAVAVTLFVLSALLPVLGAATALPMTPMAVSAAVLFGLGVGAIFPALARRRRAREYAVDFRFSGPRELLTFLDRIDEVREATSVRARALHRAEEQIERARRTYLAAYASLSDSVGRWGGSLPEVGVGAVIDAMLSEIDSVLAEAREYELKKQAMREEIAALRGRLDDENEQELRESLSPELRESLCDMSYEQILEGIRERTEQLEATRREQTNLRDEIGGLRAAATNPAELDERIRILSGEISEMRELQQALSLAYEAVSGAEENLRREITPRLSEYARRLMTSMTDGKYDEVGVSESLMLDFARGQERRSVEYLSGGTRDLAYIALRLAYIDLLYREAPPLVFDESFAHQDNFRATCTMRALRTLADEGVQSLIFTCRSRESTIAREVDRKYRHIKMEKLRAEAEAALALASGKALQSEQVIPSEPSDGETLTFAVPDAILSGAEELIEQRTPRQDIPTRETVEEEAAEEEIIEEEIIEEEIPEEETVEEELLEEEILEEEILEEEMIEEEIPEEEIIEEEAIEEEIVDEEILEEEIIEEEIIEEETIEEEIPEDAEEDAEPSLEDLPLEEIPFDLDDVLDSLYVMQGENESPGEPSPIFESTEEAPEEDGIEEEEDLEEEEDSFSGTLWSPAAPKDEDADDNESSYGFFREGEDE